MDCDTAGSKQKCDEISNKMESMTNKDYIEENTYNPPKFVERTENEDD